VPKNTKPLIRRVRPEKTLRTLLSKMKIRTGFSNENTPLPNSSSLSYSLGTTLNKKRNSFQYPKKRNSRKLRKPSKKRHQRSKIF